MRVSVLTTGTGNTEPLYAPFAAMGYVMSRTVYDAMTHKEHAQLPDIVKAQKPDLIYYIGALEDHHGKPVPHVDILAEVGGIAPMVHLCCDGAEPLWWEQLVKYYEKGRFALQVNIDGVRTGPIGERGFTTICPVDGNQFHDVPWEKRPYWCGFSGGLHFGRPALVADLRKADLLTYRERVEGAPYSAYRDFLAKTRIGLNVAYTGGGTGSMHCKARAAAEIPLAGCLLLESKGSPLSDWYTVAEHYLEYANADEAIEQIKWAKRNKARAQEMARAMRLVSLKNYSPEIYVSQVLYLLGMGKPIVPIKEVPYKYWEIGRVEAIIDSAALPRLITSKRAMNIVVLSGIYYVVPQSLGPLQLDKNNAINRPEIRKFATQQDALNSIG